MCIKHAKHKVQRDDNSLLSNFLSSIVQHALFGNVALKHMLWKHDKTIKIKRMPDLHFYTAIVILYC